MLLDYNPHPSQNPSSYRKLFPWKIQSKIQLPTGTKRELASSFYQLKLGHGYIKSYLYRLGHSNNKFCQCSKKETAEHLLLSCKELKTARDKLKKDLEGNRLSLQLLLHTKPGIEKTLDFLKETRIATQKWHLERRLDEEREEEELWG